MKSLGNKAIECNRGTQGLQLIEEPIRMIDGNGVFCIVTFNWSKTKSCFLTRACSRVHIQN